MLAFQQIGHGSKDAQHAQQALLSRQAQLQLLDAYGNYPALLQAVSAAATQWKALLQERELLGLLNAGGGPLFRRKRQEFFSALEGRLELEELPRMQRHPGRLPYIRFLVIQLLNAAAFAELTQPQPLDRQELAGWVQVFVRGGSVVFESEQRNVRLDIRDLSPLGPQDQEITSEGKRRNEAEIAELDS